MHRTPPDNRPTQASTFALHLKRRALLLIVLSLGILPAAPGLATAQAPKFETSAEACDFLAQRISGPAFLCPVSLPARVTFPGTRFVVEPQFISRRGYSLDWRPAKKRSPFSVKRAPKRFIRVFKAFLRAEHARVRLVQVRGRRAIWGCARTISCGLGWRERSSAYFVFAYRPWNASRHRVRQDLRAVARSLEPVAPASGAYASATSGAPMSIRPG
jgi:hypothetical protein